MAPSLTSVYGLNFQLMRVWVLNVTVTDVFVAKNLEKSDSTDLYIATEFAER